MMKIDGDTNEERDEEMQVFFGKFNKAKLFEVLSKFGDRSYETPAHFAEKIKINLIDPIMGELLEEDAEYQDWKAQDLETKEIGILKETIQSLIDDFKINYTLTEPVADIASIKKDLESELVKKINETELLEGSADSELLSRLQIFRIGDEIIMNERASQYGLSKPGSKGKIVEKTGSNSYRIHFTWLTGRSDSVADEIFDISESTISLDKTLAELARDNGGVNVYAQSIFKTAFKNAELVVNNNESIKNHVSVRIVDSFVKYMKAEGAIKVDYDEDYTPRTTEIFSMLRKFDALGSITVKLKDLRDELLFSDSLYGSEDKAFAYWGLQQKLRTHPTLMQEGDSILMTQCPTGGCFSLHEPDTGGCCSSSNITQVLVDFAIAYRRVVGGDNFRDAVKLHNGGKLIEPWYFDESRYRQEYRGFNDRLKRFSF